MKTQLCFWLVLICFSCAKKKNQNAIDGLKPVDVYTKLEKEGYTTTKNLGTEAGNIWTSRKSTDSTEYLVVMKSQEVNSVETIQATATITPGKEIRHTLPFLVFIGTVPYQGSNQAKIIEWLEKKFDTNRSRITIGEATFTMLTPSESSRVLMIQKRIHNEDYE